MSAAGLKSGEVSRRTGIPISTIQHAAARLGLTPSLNDGTGQRGGNRTGLSGHRWSETDVVALWALQQLGYLSAPRGAVRRGPAYAATVAPLRAAVWLAVHRAPLRRWLVVDAGTGAAATFDTPEQALGWGAHGSGVRRLLDLTGAP